MKRLRIAIWSLAGLLLITMLFAFGTTAYAGATIEGFAEVMQAGLDGLRAYFDFLLEVLELLL